MHHFAFSTVPTIGKPDFVLMKKYYRKVGIQLVRSRIGEMVKIVDFCYFLILLPFLARIAIIASVRDRIKNRSFALSCSSPKHNKSAVPRAGDCP